MKKLIGFSFLILASFAGSAQEKAASSNHQTSFGIAINAGIPVGDAASKIYTFSAGADVEADFGISQNLRATASAGYQNYSIDKAFQTFLGEKSSALLPLLGGLKYYFTPKFFGHGQVGYVINLEKGGGGHVGFAPSIGYNVTNKVDVGIKYLSVGDINALLLRLAVGL